MISEDTIVAAVRVGAGFHPRLNSFEQQRAVEMKRGCTGEPACQASAGCAKALCCTEGCIWPLPSVEPQSNMLSFRVKLVPKYLFTPIQVVLLTSLCLILGPRMLFHLCFRAIS